MADRPARLITKQTAVPGRIPTGTTGSETNLIKQGELAQNTADKKLFGFDGSNVFEFGVNTFLNLSGGTISGNLEVNGSFSANTLFSGSTDVETIIYSILSGGASSDITRIQPGSNIITGGTDNFPIINTVDSPYFNSVTASGDSVFNTIQVDSISANTLYVASLPILPTKSGIALASSFSGNPKKSTIIFSSPFENNSYSVTVTGEDSRSWRIESKTLSGFTINASANQVFTGDVFWQAIKVGESDSLTIQPQNIDGGDANSVTIDLDIDGGGA